MNEKHKERLELFVSNTAAIKKGFVWQNTLLKRLAALLYAVNDKNIDCDAIRESYEFIKKNTGLFSAFRGYCLLNTATMLSLSDDKNKLLSNTIAVYDMMKKSEIQSFRLSRDCSFSDSSKCRTG